MPIGLRAAESCEGLTEEASAPSIQAVREQLESACRAALRANCCRGDCWGDAGADADADADGDGDTDGDADEYSTTNTQEAGVDEADFIKNDGSHIYIIADDQLVILQAWPADELSDPENPEIVGELHIPGYSTYMHMMDQDHILSIGFDAEERGDFAYFQGVMLQIFDVTDMTEPTLMHRHVIGTRGTTSDATANHLAFNYFRPRDALAIPMGICEESSGGGDYGDEMTFNGLMVFDITLDDGIGEHGRIAHAIPEDVYEACDNWWTEPSSWVQRSVFMEDFVYSVAPNRIVVAHLDDLSTPVASVDLPH